MGEEILWITFRQSVSRIQCYLRVESGLDQVQLTLGGVCVNPPPNLSSFTGLCFRINPLYLGGFKPHSGFPTTRSPRNKARLLMGRLKAFDTRPEASRGLRKEGRLLRPPPQTSGELQRGKQRLQAGLRAGSREQGVGQRRGGSLGRHGPGPTAPASARSRGPARPA